MTRFRKPALVAAVGLVAAAGVAQAAIVPAGPDPDSGFPRAFVDDGGTPATTADDLTLPLCVGDDGCSPADGGAHYWKADAELPRGEAQFALVAAYAGGEVVDGAQRAFSRIHLRFDVDEAGTYRVVHPYGVDHFADVVPGAGAIERTEESGCVAPAAGDDRCDFDGGQAAPGVPFDFGRITSVLRSTQAPAGRVGDGTPTTVTGSPLPAPVHDVRLERLVTPPAGDDADGVWEVVERSERFAVEGRVLAAGPLAMPEVELDASALRFPPRTARGTSPAQIVTVRNAGAAPLTLGTSDGAFAALDGPHLGDFRFAGDCFSERPRAVREPLAPGESCRVTVFFVGTAAGPRSAELVLHTDDRDEGRLAVPVRAEVAAPAAPTPATPASAPSAPTGPATAAPARPAGAATPARAAKRPALTRATLTAAAQRALRARYGRRWSRGTRRSVTCSTRTARCTYRFRSGGRTLRGRVDVRVARGTLAARVRAR